MCLNVKYVMYSVDWILLYIALPDKNDLYYA